MRARPESGQVTLVALVLALAVMGILAGLSFTVFSGGSGSGSGGSGVGGAGVGTADDVSAKTTLSQAQSDAAAAGAAAGYGSLSASVLSGSDPDLQFTAAASTTTSEVSVAPLATGVGGATGGGAVMFATYSPSGTCWYLWLGTGGPLYGAETGQSACQAMLTAAPPATGPVSSSSVGWSAGGWPVT